MNIKQKILTPLLFLAAVGFSSFFHSDHAFAAVSKEQFLNITCPVYAAAGAGAAASSGQSVSVDELTKKCKKEASNKVGDYKYGDWKGSNQKDLKEAIKVGARTPEELEKAQSEKDEKPDSTATVDPVDGCEETTIIKVDCSSGESAIWSILLVVINVLSAGVILVAIGMFVYAAILYSSAADNAGQVSNAKGMIMNVVIGLVCYALMWSFLQFLIPGGVFKQ